MSEFILYVMSAVFFALFVWVTKGFWMNARIGEPLTKGHMLGALAVAANAILSFALYQWYGQTELHALAWATMMVAAGSLLILAAVLAIFFIAFRDSKMERAYQKYDLLVAQGKKPCLVTSSIFGPRVIESYPAHMRTNMLAWAEGGKTRCYATTTRHRLNRALGNY